MNAIIASIHRMSAMMDKEPDPHKRKGYRESMRVIQQKFNEMEK